MHFRLSTLMCKMKLEKPVVYNRHELTPEQTCEILSLNDNLKQGHLEYFFLYVCSSEIKNIEHNIRVIYRA